MIIKDEVFYEAGLNPRDFEVWKTPEQKYPTIIIRQDPYDPRDFKIDIRPSEWSDLMTEYDFQMLEHAIRSDRAWNSFVGEMITPQTKAALAATAANRAQWLVMTKVASRFPNELGFGEWMFNTRRYCEQAGLPYEQPKEEVSE